jgi:hypothetical protein
MTDSSASWTTRSEVVSDTINAMLSHAKACGVPKKIGKKIVDDGDSDVVTLYLMVPFTEASVANGRIKSLPDLKHLVKAAFLND